MAEFTEKEMSVISSLAKLKFDIERSSNQSDLFTSEHVRYFVKISNEYNDFSWALPSGFQSNPSTKGEPGAVDIIRCIADDARSYVYYPDLADFCVEYGYDIQDVRSAIKAYEDCKETFEAFGQDKLGIVSYENDIEAICDLFDNHDNSEIEEKIAEVHNERFPSFPEPEIPEEYIKVQDIMDQQDVGECGDGLAEFDSDISDAVIDAADGHIDFYNSDLLKWLPDNYSYVEDVMSEGLCDGTDFMQMIQIAQSEYFRQNIYENLEDSLRYAVYSHLLDDGIFAVTSDIADYIDNMDLSDNAESLGSLYEEIDEYTEEHGGVAKITDYYEHNGSLTRHPKALETVPFSDDSIVPQSKKPSSQER